MSCFGAAAAGAQQMVDGDIGNYTLCMIGGPFESPHHD